VSGRVTGFHFSRVVCGVLSLSSSLLLSLALSLPHTFFLPHTLSCTLFITFFYSDFISVVAITLFPVLMSGLSLSLSMAPSGGMLS
jgi:hypothetical protein